MTKLGINQPPTTTGTRSLAEIREEHPNAFSPAILSEERTRKPRQPKGLSGDAAIIRMVAIAMLSRNRERIDAILGSGRVASLGTVPEEHWPIYRSAAREVFGKDSVGFQLVRADESADGAPKFKLYKPKPRTSSRSVELSDEERSALRAYIGI